MLLAHQNRGKENRYGKNFFAILISTLGRFDRANKKNLSYTLQVNIIIYYAVLQQSCLNKCNLFFFLFSNNCLVISVLVLFSVVAVSVKSFFL